MWLGDGALPVQVRQAVTEASIELTTDMASKFTVTFLDDPDLRLFREGVGKVGVPMSWKGAWKWSVTARSLGGDASKPTVTVTALPAGVVRLQGRKGAYAWKNLSASEVVIREAAAAGMTAVTERTPRRARITRVRDATTQETSWSMFGRLADESGFLVFESQNLIWFGRPSWIIAKSTWFTLKRGGPHIIGLPELTVAENGDTGPAASIVVPRETLPSFIPGRVIVLDGYGSEFDRAYMIGSLTYTFDDRSDIPISLITPVDPVPQDPKLAPAAAGSGPKWRAAYPTVSTAPERGKALAWPVAGQLRGDTATGASVYAAAGTPVYAAANGTVTAVAGSSPATIDVYAGLGVTVRVSHVDRPTVIRTQRVLRGQRIAQIGTFGAASPYARVEVIVGATRVDPITTQLMPAPKAG